MSYLRSVLVFMVNRWRCRSRSRLRGSVSPPDVLEEMQPLTKTESTKAVNKKSYKYKRNRLVSKLKPGDHIATSRLFRSYEHHGIYEGDEKGYPAVIHFQGPLRQWDKPFGSRSRSCDICGYRHSKKGRVVTSCIDCFSQRRRMFKMQYMLQKEMLCTNDIDGNELTAGKVIPEYRNEKYYLEHYKNGKLYGHSSFPAEKCNRSKLDRQVRFYPVVSIRSSKEVLEVARKHEPGKYSLVCNNCEHFAVYCKTGEMESKQSQRCNAENKLCRNGKRKRGSDSNSQIGFEKLTPEAKRRKI